jgi:acyl-CoA synthetase (AMP-forming)/AMP-acid ligase II
MRLIDNLDRGVMLAHSRDCVVEGDYRRTYADVQRASHQIACGLLDLGVTSTTKVSTYSPNAAKTFESIMGVLRSGVVWAPVNARNALPEITHLLNSNDVEVLFYHSTVSSDLEAIKQACPGVRHFVLIDGRPSEGGLCVEDWLALPYRQAPRLRYDPLAPCAIFGSGGTTGQPKGVVHSHLTWGMCTANVLVSMPPQKPPVHLIVSPMTHAAGALALPLLAVSATQVVMKGFDARKILEAIGSHRVTHLFLPPTAVYMLLTEPSVRQHDYSSLEYFVYAAAPMSVEKLKQALDIFGPIMVQTYGQAEAGHFIGTFFGSAEHAYALNERPERLASCGRPTPFTALEIVDDDDVVLGPNEVGEIAIGGNFQMIEYYKNPAATEETRRQGWIHTGDVGRKDEEGFVYIVDRKREMIVTGGFNVFPGQIEQAIFAHPAVQDCAVVGVPDEKWGEAVKAVIVLRPGATATEQEIIHLCRERLGGVQAPKSVEFWPDLPRSAVGKVLRRSVRARYWEGRDRTLV